MILGALGMGYGFLSAPSTTEEVAQAMQHDEDGHHGEAERPCPAAHVFVRDEIRWDRRIVRRGQRSHRIELRVGCSVLVARTLQQRLDRRRIGKIELTRFRDLLRHDFAAVDKGDGIVDRIAVGILQDPGKRGELLQEAWARIAERPRDYVHHVYGEHEAGGTNFLHIAARPFEELGYRANLPTDSYRSLTRFRTPSQSPFTLRRV